MILYICGHDFHYEMENLCRVFFPNEKITVSDTLPESGAPEVETYLDGASGGYSVRVRVNVGDKTETRSAEVPKTARKCASPRKMPRMRSRIIKRFTNIATFRT